MTFFNLINHSNYDKLLNSLNNLESSFYDTNTNPRELYKLVKKSEIIFEEIDRQKAPLVEFIFNLYGMETLNQKLERESTKFKTALETGLRIVGFFDLKDPNFGLEDEIDNLNNHFKRHEDKYRDLHNILVIYQLASKILKKFQSFQSLQLMPNSDMDTLAPFQENSQNVNQIHLPIDPKIKLGGIDNRNNICYLASALQTINNISSYRNAFNPEMNNIKKGENESDANFLKRTQFQMHTFNLMEEINTGTTIKSLKFKNFWKFCSQVQKDNEAIVNASVERGDAAETLERMLRAVDYNFGSFEICTRKIPSEDFVIDENLDPSSYGNIDEINRSQNGPSLQVTGFNYLGQSVPMQTLINEYWTDEEIADLRISETNENGKNYVKIFKTVLIKKEPQIEDVPEVFCINVHQIEDSKTTIDQPENIYPFGSDTGPVYTLKSIIEHNRYHFITHLFKENNFITVNDRSIYQGSLIQSGTSYYYVKVTDQNIILNEMMPQEQSDMVGGNTTDENVYSSEIQEAL